MANFGRSAGFAGRSVPIPKFGVEVIGNLDQFSEIVSQKVNEAAFLAAKKNAKLVKETAKQLAPYDPLRQHKKQKGWIGSDIHLRDTIRIRNKARSTAKMSKIVIVSTNHGKAPHDFLVHNGTVRAAANPFLYKAAERHREEFKDGIKEELSYMERGT